MTTEDILAENERRLKELRRPYDPLSVKSAKKEEDRIRNDFAYWAAKYVYIKPKGGGDDVLFVLNRPQRKLVATLEDMRRRGEPIRLILLKARQWGGSTCVQLYMSWLQLVHQKGLNSLIIAHYNGATAEIKDMFDRMLMNYPAEMLEDESETGPTDNKKRKKKKGNGGKLTERVGNSPGTFRVIPRNCKIKVGTAESPDSCRGGDYNLVHCSEVGLWKATRLNSPELVVRSACSGVLLKPMTMIVYESTANGTGTFFHKEYEAARRGESQFKPIFVAWYEIDQYSLPFMPGEKESFARELLEGRDNTNPLSDRRQPGAYLWWLWEKGATLEAINWYVKERAKYSDHGLMAAEYPSDDIEAFVHSGARVFDKYKVEELRKECGMPVERGEVETLPGEADDAVGKVTFHADAQGALAIWKHPEKEPGIIVEDRYIVVVDIGGRSRQADWSVIAVFDRLPMRRGKGPEIVAQWRGHSDFDILAWRAARIASYYDKALLVIESNTIETHEAGRFLEGDQSQYLFNQLKEKYDNLYARSGNQEDIREGRPVKYGFHTNISTKPMIISTLVKVIREGLYTERDELCPSEYLTYEQKQNGSYGALPGHHDDILMTRAIGLHIAYNEMGMPRIREDGGNENYYHGRRPVSAAVF